MGGSGWFEDLFVSPLTLSSPYRLTWRTDVTGNLSSKKALVDVYDIFGPAPQTLQGADALATALDVLVVVPDFFKGSPMLGEVRISLPLPASPAKLRETLTGISGSQAQPKNPRNSRPLSSEKPSISRKPPKTC